MKIVRRRHFSFVIDMKLMFAHCYGRKYVHAIVNKTSIQFCYVTSRMRCCVRDDEICSCPISIGGLMEKVHQLCIIEFIVQEIPDFLRQQEKCRRVYQLTK